MRISETSLLHAKDVDEFLAYVDAAEKEKFPEEAEKKQKLRRMHLQNRIRSSQLPHARPVSPILTWRRKVWKKKAKEMGVTIKVETNGSGGAKNVLTPEEIAACDCIIIARMSQWQDLTASR